MWMVARVSRYEITSLTPGRTKRTETCVPGVPSSALETCSVVHPRVEAVSTWTIRSPS